MYAKVFRQMYEGSLATVGPWEAMITFQQFLILADRFGDVDMTPAVISRMTTIPLEIIQKGIEALTQPDPESRTPDEDGRRLKLIDQHRTWGWTVVNYQKYAKIRSAEERREYKRKWIKNKRMSTPVDTVGLSYSDSYSNSDKGERGAEAPAPQKVLREKKAKRGSLSHFVPKEWEIPDDDGEWALKNYPAVDVWAETQKFRDHEFQAARSDWTKTWRNWIRKAAEQPKAVINGRR